MTSAIDTSFITSAPVDKAPFKTALDTTRDEITALMQVFGAINLLDNAGFRINQRNYVSGTNVPAANTFTLDRWRVVVAGQNVSWTTASGVVTATAPAGGLEQTIEGANIPPGSYIINWTGTATATVAGVPVTKNSLVSLVGDTNVTVRFSNGTVSQPLLQRRNATGPATTVFPWRPVALDLLMCQRYFRPFLYFGGVFTEVNTAAFLVPGTRMRATPTATNLASGGGSGVVSATNGTTNLTNSIGANVITVQANAENGVVCAVPFPGIPYGWFGAIAITGTFSADL